MTHPVTFACSASLMLALVGCGGSSETSILASGGGEASAAGATAAGTGSIQLVVGGSGGSAAGSGSGAAVSDPTKHVLTSLPAGFQATDIGGYKLGAPIDAAGGGMSAGGSGGVQNGNCGNVLLGVARDFKGADERGGHPDFNADIAGSDVTPHLVAALLGADKKPLYTSKCEIGMDLMDADCPFDAQTTSQANFDHWYRDTPGVNQAYEVSIYLAPQPGGLFTFQSLFYFPLDGAGFKSLAKANDGKQHNFGFTTELHTQFLYSGGETFRFQGDDDVWVFINGKLAVDLGGLHPKQLRSINLDMSAEALGITKGKIYPLDLFHAERHVDASTFRVDTNLSFVDCGTVLPTIVR